MYTSLPRLALVLTPVTPAPAFFGWILYITDSASCQQQITKTRYILFNFVIAIRKQSLPDSN